MNKQTVKSIDAVVSGILVIVIGSTAIDQILHATSVYPDKYLTHGTALFASSYRLLISIAGAYLTARLAPANPMKHAMILGCIGTVLGLVGVIATWNLNLGPRWYPISLAILAIPQCWLGGGLHGWRARPAA